MALFAAKYSGLPIAVFGPAFLQSTWEREAVECNIDFSYFPYSKVHKLSEREVKDFKYWIADECHYLKSPTANRTQAFYSLIKSCLPEYFTGLTGTPIKNRLPDFWTLLAFCSLNPKHTSGTPLSGELRKYRSFSRYFCESSLMEFRGARFEKFGSVKDDKIPELKNLLSGKIVRYRVLDVLKDLPDFTRIDVNLSGIRPDPELKQEFEDYLAGRKTDSRAKKTSALLKAQHTIEYINQMRENGVDQLLVFSDHIDAAHIIGRGTGKGTAIITGATPSNTRQRYVAEFQKGGLKTLVATIGSLSVGVTLTAANHVVFNDLSWTPSDNEQAEKRIHRIGQKYACFAHFVHATPTDFHIAKTLREKSDTVIKVWGDA